MKRLVAVASLVVVAAVAWTAAPANAQDPYDSFEGRRRADDELRRRVWELERAVQHLQHRVATLEATPAAPIVVAERPWTCRVSAFGRTFIKTMPTRGQAEAHVMQACSNDSAAMHCEEVSCSQ